MGRRYNAISTVMNSNRNLCEIQYGCCQTGCSYNFGVTADRSLVSSANTMFSGVAITMQYGQSWNLIEIYVEFNIAAAKPEIVITLDLYQIDAWFFVAAILNFTYIWIHLAGGRYCNVTATPENMVLALETRLLSAICPKLKLLPVWRPPYCISHRFRLEFTTVDIALWRRPV